MPKYNQLVATVWEDAVRTQRPNLLKTMQAHQVEIMRRNGWTRGACMQADMGGDRVWTVEGYEMGLWDLPSNKVYLVDGPPNLG